MSSRQPPEGGAEPATQWRGLVIILLAVSLPHVAVSFTVNSIGVLGPFIQSDLGLSRAQVGMLTAARFAVFTLVAVLVGNLVDRIGVRLGLLFGTGSVGVVMVSAAACASSFLPLLAFLAISGVAVSFIKPTTTRGVMEWFPVAVRGTAIGVKQAGGPMGSMLAAAALPALSLALGWRPALGATGLLAVIVAVISTLLYRERAAQSGLRLSATRGDGSLWRTLLDRYLLLVAIAQTMCMAIHHTFATYLVLYLTERGVRVVRAGLLLTLAYLTGMVAVVLWGMVGDRLAHGRRKPAVLGMLAASTSAGVLMPLVPAGAPLAVWIPLFALVGLGAFAWSGPILILQAELAGPGRVGAAAGSGMAFGAFGALLGPPLFGHTVDMLGSYMPAWWGLASLGVLSALLLGTVPEVHLSRDRQEGPP